MGGIHWHGVCGSEGGGEERGGGETERGGGGGGGETKEQNVLMLEFSCLVDIT